jgi:hypothetical protein
MAAAPVLDLTAAIEARRKRVLEAETARKVRAVLMARLELTNDAMQLAAAEGYMEPDDAERWIAEIRETASGSNEQLDVALKRFEKWFHECKEAFAPEVMPEPVPIAPPVNDYADRLPFPKLMQFRSTTNSKIVDAMDPEDDFQDETPEEAIETERLRAIGRGFLSLFKAKVTETDDWGW